MGRPLPYITEGQCYSTAEPGRGYVDGWSVVYRSTAPWDVRHEECCGVREEVAFFEDRDVAEAFLREVSS